MKNIAEIITILVVLISFSGASENAKDSKKHSPIPEAVNAIEQSLSAIDRRAILACLIRSRDPLRAERISPLSGENERHKLIEWIERKWQLSDDSEFRRYFSDRGIKDSQGISSLLIDAWLENYENGEIAEEKLFRSKLQLQEIMRALKMRARMPEQQGTPFIFPLSSRPQMQALIKERQEKTKNAQEDGTGKPATRPESKSEGDYKPQPDAEKRPRYRVPSLIVEPKKEFLDACFIRDTFSSMSQTAVIQARIDPATKAAAERILETIGLTPTEAIRLLYRQIAMRGEFPLELRTPNAATAKVLTKVDRGEDVETFDSVEDLYASWE